jgi:two-component system response regulator HydG
VADGDIDLILCDLELPGGGGLRLLQQVREAHPETAVVLLSAFASVQDAVKAMQNGAADFIGKPFAADQVLSPWTGRSRRRRCSARTWRSSRRSTTACISTT